MPKNAENGGAYMNIYTTDKIRNVALLGHGGEDQPGGSYGIFVRYHIENG